ncbi:hypothetical protein SCLCIDRAFT_322361 [Scleroderma citrinum Foug A]|uniref:Uncharacterized protein n=1 Tax=Scleroderma citrinum Foug A TaxID=1036808 RepID=A0A0C3AN88_9AGAM|nr:hypothetical protein SCLCIDRAFT_322361 [Scleroderma citrinum Foug A]
MNRVTHRFVGHQSLSPSLPIQQVRPLERLRASQSCLYFLPAGKGFIQNTVFVHGVSYQVRSIPVGLMTNPCPMAQLGVSGICIDAKLLYSAPFEWSGNSSDDRICVKRAYYCMQCCSP